MVEKEQVCLIPNCHNVKVARGWCNKHYQQWVRRGDPLKRSRHPRTKEGDNICTKCRTIKPSEDFGKRKSGRRLSWCRNCCRLYRLSHMYNLTEEQFEMIFASQGGVCAGCKKATVAWRGNNGKFHVDHDHTCCPGEKSCGKCVRGVLCPNCNAILRKTNPQVLRNLADYLELYESRTRV